MRTTCKLLSVLCGLALSNALLAQGVSDPFAQGGAEPGARDPFAPGAAKPGAIKPPAANAAARWTDGEWKIRAALADESVATLSDRPLDEAVEELSEMHDIPMLIDRRGLEEVGLTPDTPVNLFIKGVSLRSLLRLMLHDMELTYIVKDEVLQITTKEVAEKHITLATYAFPENLADKSDRVLTALTTAVQPQQWSANGGSCNVAVVDHVLVVSATDNVHESVAEFLDKLEAAFMNHPARK